MPRFWGVGVMVATVVWELRVRTVAMGVPVGRVRQRRASEGMGVTAAAVVMVRRGRRERTAPLPVVTEVTEAQGPMAVMAAMPVWAAMVQLRVWRARRELEEPEGMVDMVATVMARYQPRVATEEMVAMADQAVGEGSAA